MTEEDDFECEARQDTEFEKILEQLTETDILGVVNPTGAVVIQRGPDGPRTSVAILSIWREVGKPIVHADLRVKIPFDPARKESFLPNAIVHIRGKSALHPRGQFEAHATHIVKERADDPEIREHADALKSPIVETVEGIGSLTLDLSVGWYQGNIRRKLRKIGCSLQAEHDRSLSTQTKINATRVVSDLKQIENLCIQTAVDDLFEIKNENWREDDEPRVTEKQFKKALNLLSMSCSRDGDIELRFGCGDLFWDHDISVTIYDDGSTECRLEG